MTSKKAPITLPPHSLKNSAKSVVLKTDLKQAILEDVQTLPDLRDLKLHPELTKMVCNLIENKINNNKKKKIDKKQLAIDIITIASNLNNDEISALGKQIDFLFEAGSIKNKTIKNIVKTVINFVPKLLKLI